MQSNPSIAEPNIRRPRAVILLAGQVGRNPFIDGVGRSVLDMPVSDSRTVLSVWHEHLGNLATQLGLESIKTYISVDRRGNKPRTSSAMCSPRIDVETLCDAGDYRGTAGVVKDITRDYDDNDFVLVAAANQVLREPLHQTFATLAGIGEGVAIAPSADGDLAVMFLLRCGRMRGVPDIGFVDLKEQAIPATRGHPPLRVARRPGGSAMPIRTLGEYVEALRIVHAPASPAQAGTSVPPAFAETWMPRFTILEPGARVHSGAVLQDSVVLARATVESGATVARSVICEGATVKRSQCVVDSIVQAS